MVGRFAVQNQKTVVAVAKLMYLDRRILGVVLFQVLGNLLADGFGQDGGADALAALGQLHQHTVVDVVVDQDDGLFRLAQQVIDEHIGVEYLAVKKDALGGIQAFAFERVEYLVEAVVGVDLVVDLPFFQRVHALEQAAMGGHEPAHGDKGIDDVDADLDGSFAAQHRREHGHALFGEGVGMVPSPAMGT